VIIKNCVATACFGTKLDLEEICWKQYGEFSPASFAAAKFRLRTPSTTALIFASGMMVCTGAASEESAFVAVMKFFKLVNEVVPIACCLNVKIQNIVGTAHLGYQIDLTAAFDWFQNHGFLNVIYDAELFPGLRFVPKDVVPTLQTKAKVILFEYGNVVICGAKKKDELLSAWKVARRLLERFKTEKVRLSRVLNFTYIFFNRFVRSTVNRNHKKQSPQEVKERLRVMNPVKLGVYCVVAVVWCWLVANISIEWSYNIEFERRRVQEAKLVVETVCNTVIGASLAKEFVLCEDAHIILRDEKVVWMRAFEKTLRVVVMRLISTTGKMSFAALWNVVLALGFVSLLGLFCKAAFLFFKRDDYDILSPMALARYNNRVAATTYMLDMPNVHQD